MGWIAASGDLGRVGDMRFFVHNPDIKLGIFLQMQALDDNLCVVFEPLCDVLDHAALLVDDGISVLVVDVTGKPDIIEGHGDRRRGL